MKKEDNRRLKELQKAAKPLVDFLYRYGSPHACVIVTQTSAEMLLGACATPFEPRD